MDLSTAIDRLTAVGDLAFINEVSSSTRKRASVLIPILPDGTVLLTQRTKNLRSHGGEVCFPGGKQDPEDNGDDIRTAMRETEEEVGLKAIRPIGRLPAVESYHGLCVTPVIGIVENPIELASLQLSKAEVDAVFAVPIEYFANDANLSCPIQSIDWNGRTFDMRTYHYSFQGQLFKIWGLTAYIAHQASSIATFRGEGNLLRNMVQGYFKVHHDKWVIREERVASSLSNAEWLSLKRINIVVEEEDDSLTTAAFTVHELDSGEHWKLAAKNETQRLQWIAYLKDVAKAWWNANGTS